MSNLSSSLTGSVISPCAPGKWYYLNATTHKRCENPSVVAACARWVSLSTWRSASKWRFLEASTSASSKENLQVPRRGPASAATVAFTYLSSLSTLSLYHHSAIPASIFGASYTHTPVPKPLMLCQLAQSILDILGFPLAQSVSPPILLLAYVGSSESCLLTKVFPVVGESPKSLNSGSIMKNQHTD